MERDTLAKILGTVQGVESKGSRYQATDDYELVVYLGEMGRAMSLAEVRSLTLHEGFAEIATRHEDTFFVPYEGVRAVAQRPARDRSRHRPGFE